LPKKDQKYVLGISLKNNLKLMVTFYSNQSLYTNEEINRLAK
jgi:hypothetical protein